MVMLHDDMLLFFFIFKQKTSYEMRISDWSSDVCSSDLMPISPTSFIHALRLADIPETARHAGRRALLDTLGTGAAGSATAASDILRDPDRKSVDAGKSVSVRVNIGGRLIVQ